MTSIDTWSPWIVIFFIGTPALLSAAGLAFSLYLTHRHLDAIKEALKNSRYIYLWGAEPGETGSDLVPPGNVKNHPDDHLPRVITSHR